MERLQKQYVRIALFLLPALFFYAALMVYPIASSIRLSFHSWSGIGGMAMEFVGLDNYHRIFSDAAFWKPFRNTMYLMVMSIAIQIPAGFLLAVILNAKLKGTRYFKAAFFMPVILSATSVSLMWKFILYPGNGLLDKVLAGLGMEQFIRAWLADPSTLINMILLITCWQNVGIVMLIFLSALVSIPDAILEAAAIDGAGAVQRIWRVVVPLVWGALNINIVLIMVSSLKAFDIIYVLTGGTGGPGQSGNVLSTYLFQEAFVKGLYGPASAVATVIFVLGLALTLVSSRVMRRDALEY